MSTGHAARMIQDMRATFWLENPKEREHSENLGIYGRIILQFKLQKHGESVGSTRLSRDRNRWRALVKTVMDLEGHKTLVPSWPAERLLDCIGLPSWITVFVSNTDVPGTISSKRTKGTKSYGYTLLSIRKVLGSNIEPETGYKDCDFYVGLYQSLQAIADIVV
jgi:hypothetical protein